MADNEYILGLDLGATSIGWALIRRRAIPNATDNIIAGVRVFPAGTTKNEKDVESSKTADRRAARGLRRIHRRRTMRKNSLCSVLTKGKLWPADRAKQTELLRPEVDEDTGKRDPLSVYYLRAAALDHKLEPEEIGRVLLHMAQRRGFKSNRKTDNADKKESGKVKEGIGKLAEAMKATGARSLGEFFAYHIQDSEIERRRANYTSRQMYEDEFELIWEKQKEFHPDLLTDSLKKKVHHALFYQRPFDKGADEKIGPCTYIKTEKRARVGDLRVQRFRLWQEINNLRYMTDNAIETPLTDEQRKTLFAELDKREKMTFVSIRNKLKLPKNTQFSIEANGKIKSMRGNASAYGLAKAFGKRWAKYTEKEQYAICADIMTLSDDELLDKCQKDWNLDDETTDKVMSLFLKDRPGHVSIKAIEMLLPHLEAGLSLHDALVKEDLLPRAQESEACDFLPLPTPENMNEQEVTNPVVRISLFQLRTVINAIIRKYGKPARIVIEFARNTKGSIKERNKKTSQNRKNEEERAKIIELLKKKHNLPDPKPRDVIKYRLWKESNECCPYCGKKLSIDLVFKNGEAQIEHIIPYSVSLDDSFLNKTLACQTCNSKKGNHTPWEAWGHDENRFEQICQRFSEFASDCRWAKMKRITQRTDEPSQQKMTTRLLNDTRYICRQARAFLQKLYSGTGAELDSKVRVNTGRLTAELRHQWDLNSILNPKSKVKNRGDHRHHAVDAIVIALTNQDMVTAFSDWSKQHRNKDKISFGPPNAFMTKSGDPESVQREFFRQAEAAINRINVSFKPERRVRGPLHNESNYGMIDENTFVLRKPLADITMNEAQNIRDEKVRALVLRRLEEWGVNTDPAAKGVKFKGKEVFAEPLYMSDDGKQNGNAAQIKKVRIKVTGTGLIPFKDKDGKNYRYAMPDNNHHLEIYEYTDKKGKTKRKAVAVTLFEARRRVRAGEPVVTRKLEGHPDAKLLVWFCKNDMVLVNGVNKGKTYKDELCRVQKFSTTLTVDISLRKHTAATLLNEEEIRIVSLPLDLDIKKVTVTPLGRIIPNND